MVQVSVLSLKDDTISFIPNAPASTHHSLFEKMIGRSVIPGRYTPFLLLMFAFIPCAA
jgi:hypothetical protein